MSETLNETNSLLDNTIECNNLEPDKPKEKCRNLTKSNFENMANDINEAIDTNAIVNMLKDTSLEDAEAVTDMTKTSKQKITETESCNGNINKTMNDDIQTDLTNNESNCKKCKQSRKPITEKRSEQDDKKAKYETRGTENWDTNYNNLLIGSDQQTDLTNNDKDCTKSDIISKQSKKRDRKSNAEKLKPSIIENKLKDIKSKYQSKQTYDSNPQKYLRQLDNTNPQNVSKQHKKPDRNSIADKLTQSYIENDQKDKTTEYQRKQTCNSDLQISLSQIVSVDLQTDLTNNDNDLKKAAKPFQQPKKRKRILKSINAEKLKQLNAEAKPEKQKADYQMKQTQVNDNDSQILLTTINGDNDLKKTVKQSEQPKKRGRKPKSLNNTSASIFNSTTNKTGILKYFNAEDVAKNSSTKKRKTLETANSENVLHYDLNDDIQQGSLNGNNDSTEMTANMTEQRSKKSTADTSLTKSNLNKSSNTEKRKRGRPKSDNPRVVKVNVAREFQKKRFIKISKLTKKQIKNGVLRKIPKNRLDEVLKIIDDEDHPIWEERNISCNTSIYGHWEPRNVLISNQNIKLKYARQFILRRDWIGLSKVLHLSNTEAKIYYPLLSKYATLLLAHTDKEQFNKFVQFLTNMNDSSAVIKNCTKISKENEV